MANKRILKKRGYNEVVEMIDLISRINIKIIPLEKNNYEMRMREKEVMEATRSINEKAKKYEIFYN